MSPDSVSTISKGYMARDEINTEYSLDISLGSEKYVKLITESIHTYLQIITNACMSLCNWQHFVINKNMLSS